MTSMTYVFSQEQHGHLVPYIAALHASCITLDHMVGPFLPPLTNEKLLPWWKERIAEVARGTRVIVLLLPESSLGKKPLGTELRGLAMLKLSETETGSFRGHIDAVLVDRKHRRQGGGKALVMALEYEAAKRGRSLLVGYLVSRGRNIADSSSSSTPRPTVWASWPSGSLATLKLAKCRTSAALSPTERRARPSFTRSSCLRHERHSRLSVSVLCWALVLALGQSTRWTRPTPRRVFARRSKRGRLGNCFFNQKH